jgi:hypothetical protein
VLKSFLRHQLPTIGSRIDMTVAARLIAELAHVHLQRRHLPAFQVRHAVFVKRLVKHRQRAIARHFQDFALVVRIREWISLPKQSQQWHASVPY